MSIGTGGGGGREAPILQVGAAIGSTVGQLLKFSPDRTRTLLGCGAAAALRLCSMPLLAVSCLPLR